MNCQNENKIIETEIFDLGFEKIGGIGEVLFHFMAQNGDKIAQVCSIFCFILK